MRSLLAVLIVGFAACRDLPTTPTVSVGTPFALRVGQTATVGSTGMSVKFNRVVSEGRCPSDVMCFWEGEAVIELAVTRPTAAPAAIPLRILGYVTKADTAAQLTLDTLGYQFTLMQLDPYPKTASPHLGSLDVATLQVTPFIP